MFAHNYHGALDRRWDDEWARDMKSRAMQDEVLFEKILYLTKLNVIAPIVDVYVCVCVWIYEVENVREQSRIFHFSWRENDDDEKKFFKWIAHNQQDEK